MQCELGGRGRELEMHDQHLTNWYMTMKGKRVHLIAVRSNGYHDAYDVPHDENSVRHPRVPILCRRSSMNRRALVAGIAAIPLLSGCFWDRYFDLIWEEEVQLDDGRVIVVKLTHTYERQHREFGRYTSAIPRDTELLFDAGGAVGKITQLFKGGKPLLLDQHEGIWYLVLSVAPYNNSQLLPGQDWGPDQNGNGQHVATLQGREFKPVSICVLPDRFRKPNFLVRYANADELSKFNGKLVPLREKQTYLAKYPLLYGDADIERPSARSELVCLASKKP